jgi:hypothetical protein
VEKGLTDENLPEENQVGTLTWGRLIVAAILLGCIFMHSQGFESALILLNFLVSFFFIRSMFHQGQIVQGSFSIAVAIVMGDEYMIRQAAMDNPYSNGLTTLLVANLFVAYYLFTNDFMGISVVAILPNITMFFVYERLMKFLHNADVQQIAMERMKLAVRENKRIELLQEEINKVLPDIERKVEERFNEIFNNQEETTNESRESNDPD